MYKKMINNICCPILAITPFPTSLVSQGIQGEVGLSGPNVELIAFNSGDTPITPNLLQYAVGLGVSRIIGNFTSVELSQLGVVLNQPGKLSNFEIAYTANSIDVTFNILYRLVVVRSLNNNGNDYTVLIGQTIFSGNLMNTSLGEGSGNRVITIPLSSGNINIGDRLILIVTVPSSSPPGDTQITVSASILFTPSGI